jgi:hypothetical protein
MGALTAALIGSGIMQAGSQIAAGKTAKYEYDINAIVAQQQADIAKYQADVFQAKKGFEEYRYNRQIAKYSGFIRSRTGKAGIEMSGSPLAFLLDTQTQLEMDKFTGQYNLETQRQFSLAEARNYQIASRNYRRAGKQALTAGYINAFSTLLQTGSQAGSRMNFSGWGQARSAGAYERAWNRAGLEGTSQSKILGFDTARYAGRF